MIRYHWRRLRSKYPWMQLIRTWRFWVLVAFIILLLIYVSFAMKKQPVPYMHEEIQTIQIQQMEFDFQTGLFFLGKGKNVFLRGSMPDLLQAIGPPKKCGIFNASKQFCAQWSRMVRLEVVYSEDQHASCYSVSWQPTTDDYQPQACFSLVDYKWFGGSLLYDQAWPINTANLPFQPFMSQDLRYYTGNENVFGNVLDWFWISSAGVAVMVDHSLPLYISVNQSGDNLLCMYSTSENRPSLKYRVCKSDSLRKIHRYVISQMVNLPKSLPADGFFSKPLWSTSPYFNDSLDQSKLHQFGVDINERGLTGHVLEMYDNSLTLYNQTPFDKKRFANIHQVIMYLHDLKFSAYMPVSPFVSTAGNWNKSHLVQDSTGNPLVANFNDEDVHLINLLKAETLNWFVKGLQSLQSQIRFDGYRLVGGESVYLTIKTLKPIQMNEYSIKLSSVMEGLKQTCLTSFASLSQSGANIIKLSSRESSWGTKGGLASVIPSVFTLGILGYPFMVPNVIGGPGKAIQINSTYTAYNLPDRELYIRWLALSAYMPVMMFSVPPWAYDDEVLNIAKQFAKIHEEVVSPLVIKAAREYEISGSPIIRPLWWLDPLDRNLLTISDEYLIGDSLLVAPIVKQGATHRDIYIPEGRWRDKLRDVDVIGKDWLKDYQINLGQIASFSKLVKAV